MGKKSRRDVVSGYWENMTALCRKDMRWTDGRNGNGGDVDSHK